MTEQTIAFLDCETTSLRTDRRAWEIGIILRRPGQPDHEQSWFVEWHDLDLGNAELKALEIGGFYSRHPQGDRSKRYQLPPGEENVLLEVEELTRGAIVMGSNPSFDTETLTARMRAHGVCPSWHYHLEDVPTLAKGWLYGTGKQLPETWKSDAISLACGIDPAGYDRHTALGDCRWTRDLHDLVTGVKAATR